MSTYSKDKVTAFIHKEDKDDHKLSIQYDYSTALNFIQTECFKVGGCTKIKDKAKELGITGDLPFTTRETVCAGCQYGVYKYHIIYTMLQKQQKDSELIEQLQNELEALKNKPVEGVKETKDDTKEEPKYKAKGKAPEWNKSRVKRILEMYYNEGIKKGVIAKEVGEHPNTVGSIVDLKYYSKEYSTYDTQSNHKVIGFMWELDLLKDDRVKALIKERGIDLSKVDYTV